MPTVGATRPPSVSLTKKAWDGLGTYFHALVYRDFRLFWFGMLGAVFGQNMQFVTLGWLVLQLTNAPVYLGAVGLAQAVPSLGLTFFAGALADRMDRKRMLLASQFLSALLYFGLGALVLLDLIEVWQVMVFAFALGAVKAFDGPSRGGLIPHLVPEDEVPSAVALLNAVWQLPRIVGPALAGIMMAAFGAGPTLVLAGTVTALSVLLLALVNMKQAPLQNEGSFLQTLLDGMKFIRRNETFWGLFAMTFMNSIFGMSYTYLIPVFARDLGVGPEGYGFLQTAGGWGGMVGLLFAAGLSAGQGRGLKAIVCSVIYGIGVAAFALSPSYPLSIVLIILVSVTNQIYMTIIATVLLLKSPDEYRGRVMSVYQLAYGLVPLGSTVTGSVAQLTSAQVSVAIGGGMVALVALAFALYLPGLRRLQ